MKINEHKKNFGNQAENYTRYRKPYPRELYDLIFSLLPKEAKKILDIACGTGKSTEPLVRDGLEIIGIDHDSLMIAEAQKQAELKNLPIKYSVAEVEQLPFSNQEFDAITIGTAFHWFANDKAIEEIRRVLRDRGLLLIFWTLTTKNVPEEDSIPREIFQKFNWEKVPSELRDLDYISAFLIQKGFKDVSTARIPFTHNDTVEDQVGLMKTASSYELLSEEDKVLFIDEITKALTERLSDRPFFTYEEEIQVCYGFK